MDQYTYDYCIIITTYNRPKLLEKLLNDIDREGKNARLHIVVFDDASTENYDFIKNYKVKYIKFTENNGLKRFWKIIDKILKYCKYINSKYFFFLQDDLRLNVDFFEKTIEIYDKIEDPKKVTLGTLMIESQVGIPKWTGFEPIKFGDYYLTQWVELVFMCEKKFFNLLDHKMFEIPLSRWNKNPNLSSGVGEQISHRLLTSGVNMYHVSNSLTYHGDHESKLFDIKFRDSEKLISN